MTDDYVSWEGLGGGKAATQALPSINSFKALSF